MYMFSYTVFKWNPLRCVKAKLNKFFLSFDFKYIHGLLTQNEQLPSQSVSFGVYKFVHKVQNSYNTCTNTTITWLAKLPRARLNAH